MLLAAVAFSLLLPQSANPDWTPETPVRILLNITQDPARTATVTWRTAAEVKNPVAQIAVASPDPRFVADALTVPATATTMVVAKSSQASYYRVNFADLKPGTEYSYRVGDGGTWSEWVHFSTAQDKPAPFSFIYFGDAQNEIKSLWSRTIRKAFRDLPYAAFMLHAGDLINNANADNQWGEWFYAGGWTHAAIPTVATPGNHEYGAVLDDKGVATGKTILSSFWNPQFAMPSNGVPGLEQTCYYFDYQGARFISLNSNERVEEQAPWLDSVLKANPHKWSFVTFHHPVYSTAGTRDNPKVRASWGPILQKHNVAIVMQGHDHTYGRVNVPIGVSKEDAKTGTVYTVSVSGPKMYRLGEAKKSMQRVAEYTQLYQLVRVSPDKVRYEAYTVTGELYDAFELRKNKNGTNRFIAVKVDSKQRLEPEAPAKK